MKKTLMGTTALVAAAVAVSGARADEMMAEPISLSVGGNSHWGVAIVDNEDATMTDDIVIGNDVELQFKGSTVLDSGIEVGVRFELEGEQDDDQMDETYAYVEGSFGEIRIGNDDAVSAQMSTAAPYSTYFFSLNSPYWSWEFSSAGSISTFPGVSIGDSASLMYFSPRINGFQFGVSYAPEAGAEARSGVADMSEGGEAISVGANYSGSFGDAGIFATTGYLNQDVAGADGTPDSTITDWAAALQISMSGVTVGGSYRVTDDDTSSDDAIAYDFGIMYGEGPWSISVNWGHGEGNGVDSDLARLLATYSIGPGVHLAGALGADSPASGNDTTLAGIALGISF